MWGHAVTLYEYDPSSVFDKYLACRHHYGAVCRPHCIYFQSSIWMTGHRFLTSCQSRWTLICCLSLLFFVGSSKEEKHRTVQPRKGRKKWGRRGDEAPCCSLWVLRTAHGWTTHQWWKSARQRYEKKPASSSLQAWCGSKARIYWDTIGLFTERRGYRLTVKCQGMIPVISYIQNQHRCPLAGSGVLKISQ